MTTPEGRAEVRDWYERTFGGIHINLPDSFVQHEARRRKFGPATHGAGFPPLCSYSGHPENQPPVFCDEPATGIVMHWDYLTGRVSSHDYCATHGRLIADKVAAIAAAP